MATSGMIEPLLWHRVSSLVENRLPVSQPVSDDFYLRNIKSGAKEKCRLSGFRNFASPGSWDFRSQNFCDFWKFLEFFLVSAWEQGSGKG